MGLSLTVSGTIIYAISIPDNDVSLVPQTNGQWVGTGMIAIGIVIMFKDAGK